MCQLLIQIIGITLLVSDRYRNRTFPLSYPKSATPVDDLPKQEPQLQILRKLLEANGNPTAFPDTSIFNENWDDWR